MLVCLRRIPWCLSVFDSLRLQACTMEWLPRGCFFLLSFLAFSLSHLLAHSFCTPRALPSSASLQVLVNQLRQLTAPDTEGDNGGRNLRLEKTIRHVRRSHGKQDLMRITIPPAREPSRHALRTCTV